MNLSKPYKYAALAVLFLGGVLFGFWVQEAGIAEKYFGDKLPYIAVLVASVVGMYAAYKQRQQNQSASC